MPTSNKITYCNPLPVPDYPRGFLSYNNPDQKDFRELADPSVIYHDGKWYLYPSCGMAYVTEDFINWAFHRIEPYPPEYAPTVVCFQGKFYMSISHSPLFIADDPLGPFVDSGWFTAPNGERINVVDPMLFADGDRLYIYWGLAEPGIFGAELSTEEPHRMITEPKILLSYNPDHVWERYGANNQNPHKSYVEGSWMVKVNGRYFLTYSAPGTEFPCYGMGTYVSDEPLGGFVYQQRNPISAGRYGLIKGPGHGCIVEGPGGTLWAFYTIMQCHTHMFERRIGMDPAGIDAAGNLFVYGPSDIPQLTPGNVSHPELGNDAGWLSLTQFQPTEVTSTAPGRDSVYAVDDSLLSWWQPAEEDPKKQLMVRLNGYYTVHAFRIVWRDVNLDYDHGVLPGAFQYRVEGAADEEGKVWETLFDASANEVDLLIDYREITPTPARFVRLTILGAPKGIEPGVIHFAAFGVSL